METRIALFQQKEIRKTIHANEWWFVVVDVVAALTDSVNPAGYLKDMRKRDVPLSDALKGGGQIAPPLPWRYRRPADRKNSCAGTPRASSTSPSPPSA